MPRNAALLLLPALPLLCQDWPQLLGPTRNGVYSGDDLALAWPAGGPPLVWKKEVGAGFAAPAVARGKLILFHRRGDREIVEALDAATGKTLWTFAYPTAYRDDFGFDEGPRGTPAVANGRVYTFGAEGMLHCLDFASGRKLWSVDTHKTFDVPKGFFGAAASPLADQGRILLNVGGARAGIAAFDAETGKTLWTALADEAGYSSPVAATIRGTPQALFFTRAGLVATEPATGKVRFQFPWRSRSHASVNAALPQVVGDQVFLSASYSTGAVLLDLSAGAPRKVWASDDVMSNHYATAVHRDGHLYGYHGRQEMGPSLRCVELKTGKVVWDVAQFRAGSILLAGARLLIQREGGELVLVPATPAGFAPSARARILDGVVRAYPALANGLYYARNERTLVCLKLAGR